MANTSSKRQPNATKVPSISESFFDPFLTATSMRRMMDTFFESFGAEPRVNVSEVDGGYVIECAVPGYKKDDITLEAGGNEVTVSGRFSKEETEEQRQYRRHEMRRGEFSRTIAFPTDIDPESVKASLEKGILKVELRPLKPIASKKIPIAAK